MSRTVVSWTPVVLAIALLACGPRQPRLDVDLEEVPAPSTEGLEPPVAEQLQEAWREVRRASSHTADQGAAFGRLGQIYQAYELPELAAPAYRNAAALQPEDPRWPYYLGHLALSRGDADDAIQSFERSRTLLPDHPATLAALAQTYREEGRLDEAESTAQELLEIDPENPVGNLVLAEVAMDRDDPGTARRRYETLLRAHPEATRLYGALAAAYRALGHSADADALARLQGEQGLTVEDEWLSEIQTLLRGSRALSNRAVEAFDNRDFTAAAESFAEALELSPEDRSLRRNYAASLLRAGRVDEALAQYDRLLDEEPTDVETLFQKGRAQTEAGDVEGAERSYERALEIAPDHLPSRYNLANLHRRQGNLEEALAGFRELIARDPNHERARIGEAVCLIGLERWSGARASIKAGLQVVPTSMTLAQLGVRVLAAAPVAEVRDGQQALGLAEKLLRLNGSFQHYEILAMALGELGRFDEAVAMQERALEGAHTSGASEDRIGRMEAALAGYRRGEPTRDPLVD